LVCRGRATVRRRHRHRAFPPFPRALHARAMPGPLSRRRQGGRVMSTETLDLQLAQLRAELGSLTAPPALGAALVGRFRRAHNPRPRLWWMPPLALAAVLSLVSWMIRAPLPPLPVAPPEAQ